MYLKKRVQARPGSLGSVEGDPSTVIPSANSHVRTKVMGEFSFSKSAPGNFALEKVCFFYLALRVVYVSEERGPLTFSLVILELPRVFS